MDVETLLRVICIVSSCWIVTSMTLSNTQKKCFDGYNFKEEGTKFDHYFDGSRCKFECTCLIRKQLNFWVPTGSCAHRCPALEIPPYGCQPISDGCCAKTYFCPQGEKCRDKETGLQYVVGATWERQGSGSICECTCYGEGVGRYQCECVADESGDGPQPRHDLPMEVEEAPKECILDDSESCKACPVGMTTCPIRAKCEGWTYLFRGVQLECKCQGKEGTHCVSRKEVNNTEDGSSTSFRRRAKRSRPSKDGDLIEMYFSEDATQTIEPTFTEITKEFKFATNHFLS